LFVSLGRGGEVGSFCFFVDDRFSDMMMGRKEGIHARNLQTTRSSQVHKTETLK
jgi:hypothetical protein